MPKPAAYMIVQIVNTKGLSIPSFLFHESKGQGWKQKRTCDASTHNVYELNTNTNT